MESEQREQRQRQKSTNKKPIESERQMAKRTPKSISQIYKAHKRINNHCGNAAVGGAGAGKGVGGGTKETQRKRVRPLSIAKQLLSK